MGRILGIDYGTKRTGIAVTDETQTFAFGLTTVPTHELFGYLEKYLSKNEVDGFVVGEPKRMNNTPTHASEPARAFSAKLLKKFPGKKIYRIDERFSSSIAKQSIRDSGVKKKDREKKELIDMVSATIILQSWLMNKEL